MSLKSTEPAYQQLQQFLPLLDALVDILQPLKRLYKALKEYLRLHPTAASPHTPRSILWHTIVMPLASALDAALLVLKPAMGLKCPVPLDWCLSALSKVWSGAKAGGCGVGWAGRGSVRTRPRASGETGV